LSETAVPIGDADVIERLARLRALLPAMAEDLARARRRAAALAAENERLAARVRELESPLAPTRSTGARRRRGVRASS
jgi:aldehyde:ferredoxin oxidoreductase